MKLKILALLLVLVSTLTAQSIAVDELMPSNKPGSDLICLASTIYYEAGNQSEQGKVAVAFVVLNRLRDVQKKDPSKKVCDVVLAKQGRVCQFAWTCNVPKHPFYKELWLSSLDVARRVLDSPGSFKDPTNGAVAFRRPVDPDTWFKSLVRTASIGGHIFYRLD